MTGSVKGLMYYVKMVIHCSTALLAAALLTSLDPEDMAAMSEEMTKMQNRSERKTAREGRSRPVR